MKNQHTDKHNHGFQTDVVTREIVRGKLLAIADEMGVVLKRSSMSPVIYEVLDFACGFCDPTGELVSQTNGITVITGTFSIQIYSIKFPSVLKKEVNNLQFYDCKDFEDVFETRFDKKKKRPVRTLKIFFFARPPGYHSNM